MARRRQQSNRTGIGVDVDGVDVDGVDVDGVDVTDEEVKFTCPDRTLPG